MTHGSVAGDSHTFPKVIAGDTRIEETFGGFDDTPTQRASSQFGRCTPGVFEEIESAGSGPQPVHVSPVAGSDILAVDEPYGETDKTLTLETAAAQIESMMPRIARRLFTVYPNDPAGELPNAQLRMCSFLQHGPSPITSIADELSISVSAATQLADRLEKTGMVERTGDTSDRRVRLVSLTAHGIEVMRSRQERRRSQVRQALSRLSEDERVTVVESLAKLLNASTEEHAKDMDGGK